MGGDVRPTSKILYLFMTKIYDFLSTIYDLTEKLNPLFMPFAAGTVALRLFLTIALRILSAHILWRHIARPRARAY